MTSSAADAADKNPPTGNRKAAWTLLVLPPLIAELSFATPLRYAFLVVLWLPIYGCGVLLIRELVVRVGRGWTSIVILGLAYEIVEDGIGLQALSSPNLYHAAEWGARVFGLNLPYWEVQAIYHVVFSLTIPVLLTGMLFPAHRGVPYLKRTGLVITAIVALLGVGLLRVTVPPIQDPGYMAPAPVLIGCVIAVLVLGVIALRIVPRPTPLRPTDVTVPGLTRLALFGAAGTVVVLCMLFPVGPLGARTPSFTHGWWVLLPMAGAAVLCALAGWLVRRWYSARTWTDRHALALAGGAMVGHTLIGPLVAVEHPVDRAGLIVIAALTAAMCLVAIRRMHEAPRA